MARKENLSRTDILEAAQARFERSFIEGTMKDIARARARLQRQSERLSGADAGLRQSAIKADLRRLDGIERKVQGVLRAARRNLKAQLGGAEFRAEATEGAVAETAGTARRSSKKGSK